MKGAETLPPCLALWLAAPVGLLMLGAPSPLPAQTPQMVVPAAHREFPPGRWQRWEELPDGRFRRAVTALPAPARERARAWLQSVHFTTADLESLYCDSEGGIFYQCRFPVFPASSAARPEDVSSSPAPLPVSPFPDSLKFHSRPGAPNVLYLNFAGETVTNTQWNTELGREVIPALPFSTDADYTTFSDTEQAMIRAIWQRVAEDYAPFDINVTTERPSTFHNRTAVVLITRNTDANGLPNPASDSGGVSYVNVFGTLFYARYRPAWVYANNLGHVESYIAEAASHEAGHNFGLTHDGRTDGVEYYTGHGSGDISWGPIMGAGYNRNVTQWSKGEYYLANNTQDDLAVIASKIGYRPDDHGQGPATATPLVLTGGTNVVSTTPQTDPANTNRANKGVLERNDDVDWFSFVTGTGPIQLTVRPWIMASGPRGGNLDLSLELYDSAGNLLLTNNPPETTSATISTQLSAGMYFLAVRNSGAGNPWQSPPTGYTAYGSLGQYFFEGWVTDPSGVAVPPVAILTVSNLTDIGKTNHLLTVVYSDNVAVQRTSVGDGDLWVSGPNGFGQYPRLVSVSTNADAPSITAVYSLTPPDETVWLPRHNGLYEVWMVAQEVADTEGTWVPPGRLGQFTVAVPTVYYMATMDTDPGWTLEPLWQYGRPAYASGGPTGGATGTHIIGYNLTGPYENNLPFRYATTPPISTVGATSLSLRFERWLRLRRGDTARIEVSTNGTQWLEVWSSTGAISDTAWRQMQYDLPAAVVGSSQLRIRWGLASNPSQTDLGWHIDDVVVLGQGVQDQAPPQPLLRISDVTLAGTIAHSCSVEFTDETGVRLATLDSEDLWVTGPNGYAAWAQFVAADSPMDAVRITATYAIPPPNGSWQAEHNGVYTVSLAEGAVEDVWGRATPGQVLGTFEVRIPVATPATLAVWPHDDWQVSGMEGGPFSPDSKIYCLTNLGSDSIRFAVDSSVPWVTADPASGELVGGQGQCVQVRLTSEATALPAGSHSATLSFLNLSTGQGQTTRGVSLEIAPRRQFQLLTAAQPSAWGRVEPSEGRFVEGSSLTLRAYPETWFTFVGWTGDVASADNPLSLVITRDLTVVAVFAELKTTNHPTPLWWLAELGHTNDFEVVVEALGANGLPLWQSYIAGLDPRDPDSRFRLEISGPTGSGEILLRWDPRPGRAYSLWQSSRLEGPFEPVPGALDLDPSVRTWTLPPGPDGQARYYRLSVKLAGTP